MTYNIIRISDNKIIAIASSFRKADLYFKLSRRRTLNQEDLLNRVMLSKKYNINVKIVKVNKKWEKQTQIVFLEKLENKL